MSVSACLTLSSGIVVDMVRYQCVKITVSETCLLGIFDEGIMVLIMFEQSPTVPSTSQVLGPCARPICAALMVPHALGLNISLVQGAFYCNQKGCWQIHMRTWFNISIIWGKSQSCKGIGMDSSTPDKTVMKWLFRVWIALSTRWWYFFIISLDASLSEMCIVDHYPFGSSQSPSKCLGHPSHCSIRAISQWLFCVDVITVYLKEDHHDQFIFLIWHYWKSSCLVIVYCLMCIEHLYIHFFGCCCYIAAIPVVGDIIIIIVATIVPVVDARNVTVICHLVNYYRNTRSLRN